VEKRSISWCEEDGLVSSRRDHRVMIIEARERVSEEERGENFHSLETI